MNLYVLDEDPRRCAAYHTDRHVPKQLLESAQLLSTAHLILDGHPTAKQRVPLVLRPTHINHPCAVWTRENLVNYQWVYSLMVALAAEYYARFGKVHLYAKTGVTTEFVKAPLNIAVMEKRTPFPMAMPVEYKGSDAVGSYRAWYSGDKHHLASWSPPATRPKWFTGECVEVGHE